MSNITKTVKEKMIVIPTNIVDRGLSLESIGLFVLIESDNTHLIDCNDQKIKILIQELVDKGFIDLIDDENQ